MAALKLEGGGTLVYDDDGVGRPLLFLHGWSLRRQVFSRQREALAARFRVVVPDLRGHGESSPAGPGSDMASLAGDVASLIETLDLDRVIVVGWSMGAMVAWQLAQGRTCRRMAGLVSIDMVPRVLNTDDWRYGLTSGPHDYDVAMDIERMRDDWRSFAAAYVPRIFAEGRAEERGALVSELLDLVADNDVDSMIRLWSAMTTADYRDVLAKLDLPMLITYGSRSQVYPAKAAAWMANEVPHSERVGFENSGHAPHMEEPDLFNEILVQYADRLVEGRVA